MHTRTGDATTVPSRQWKCPGELFDSTIVHDELPVTEMPPVQLSTLLAMRDEETIKFRQTSKSNIITACFNLLLWVSDIEPLK